MDELYQEVENGVLENGIFEKVRRELLDSVDETYREFNSSLVPGEGLAPMLGVRMPKVRSLAKKLAKDHPKEYIEAARKAEKDGRAYHEEYLLHGIIIGSMKCSVEERKKLLDAFVPVIDSWAICDSVCISCKFMQKQPEEWYAYLEKYLKSTREYEIRFGVVCLLDYYITEEYLERTLKWMDKISHDGYYVKMAVAWAVSMCFVKFPEETRGFLMENHMDDFTHNKAIQKIRESYKVSKEDKEWVQSLKREKTKKRMPRNA